MVSNTSDAVPFFLEQCTRNGATVVANRLPDGRYARPASVSVRYAVCTRVFNNSGPDGSRDRAVARMRDQVLGSECPCQEDTLSAVAVARCLMAVRGPSLARARDERAMPTQTTLGFDLKTGTGTDPRNGLLAGSLWAVLTH